MKAVGKAALGIAAGLLSAVAQAGEYSIDVGAEVTRGDYGTTETSTVWSLPLGIRYQGERLFWSLSLPYLIVNAPSDFVVTSGGGRGPSGFDTTETRTSTRTVTGVGDLTAAAGWSLMNEAGNRPWVGVAGEVKFATADENENLGTGENDFALQVAAAKGWLNGRVGYRWLGDSATTDYDDPLYYAVGVRHVYESGGDIGLEWYGEEAIASGTDERQELTLYGSYPVQDGMRVQGYVFKGFTDASAEVGAGAGLSFAL